MEQLLKKVKAPQGGIPDIIANPAHYVTGRTIQPINVIEDWNLGHQLACVVKYIARVGRKNPVLEDLKKAEWYLDRALLKERFFYQDESTPQQESFGRTVTFSVQSICDDWQLSDRLCSTIINIFLSVDHPSHLSKEKALKAALSCLREEITIQEVKQNFRLPENRGQVSKKKRDNRVSIITKEVERVFLFQFL